MGTHCPAVGLLPPNLTRHPQIRVGREQIRPWRPWIRPVAARIAGSVGAGCGGGGVGSHGCGETRREGDVGPRCCLHRYARPLAGKLEQQQGGDGWEEAGGGVGWVAARVAHGRDDTTFEPLVLRNTIKFPLDVGHVVRTTINPESSRAKLSGPTHNI